MLGKLSLAAIPIDQPIPLIASGIVGVFILGVLAWVIIAGYLPYLWQNWITSVDHKRIGVMYVLLAGVMLLRGFVDALRDENTLVITASAPDKNSFGCSNEAEWTYFGKAYFDEALRHTYSFVKAFELAKPVIADRERKEDFTPSEPQMALGRAIEPKLAQLEKQLNAKK